MEISQIQMSVDDVTKHLIGLDTSKACGPDGIPVRLLKECSQQIAPSLCGIFNHSLSSGQIPTEWKSADITPIHKRVERACRKLPTHITSPASDCQQSPGTLRF